MRYAKALLAFAKGGGGEEQVCRELKALAESWTRVPGLRRAVENPVLPASEKLALLRQAAGGEGVSGMLLRFFRLVLEGGREALLPFMAWAYVDLYHADKGILVGRLVTAAPAPGLAARLEAEAARRTRGRVELETAVDPALIGGFVMQLGDLRLDASVATQLERVRTQLEARNRRIV